MKIVVIGASGLIGQYLMREFSKDCDVIGVSRNNLAFKHIDISNKKQITSFLQEVKPDVIIVTAAVTHVDYCESHPKETYKTNVAAIKYICDYASKEPLQPHVVFLSSDYIFNGEKGSYKEADSPHPLNIYGQQKLDAEKYIQQAGISFLIIRTNWVYGAEKARKNFVYTVRRLLAENQEITVASDQIANPTYAGDIARGIHWLVRKKKTGIFHIAGKDYVDRLDFAREIAKAFGLPNGKVVKKATEEMGQVAKRPLRSGLQTDYFVATTGMHCLGIKKGLQKMKDDETSFF